MKRLSDYKNEEAMVLWGEILEPMSNIIADPKVAEMFRGKDPAIKSVSYILKEHPKDVSDILLKIDPTPLNAINIAGRLVDMFREFLENEELQGFFGLSEQEEKMQVESTGSVMENTGDGEN